MKVFRISIPVLDQLEVLVLLGVLGGMGQIQVFEEHASSKINITKIEVFYLKEIVQ